MSVFVNGGSSAVGAFAIQFAKARGCTVWASASGKNGDFLKGLGVDEVCLPPDAPRVTAFIMFAGH